MKNEPTLTLVAPLTGIVVPLDEVPDPVFSQRLVGDGVAIDPLSQVLMAPCAARVLQVHRAGHALTLETNGIEIMMHIGLDTVNLKGAGFTPHVRAGDEVRPGDHLISFDADYIATHARSLLTEIIITSTDRVSVVRARSGVVSAAQDPLLELTLADAGGSTIAATGETYESPPVQVVHPTGLHARPAALIAARARGFSSEIKLIKGDREANARSLVAIMALEVMQGDAVRVVARGSDAREAVEAIVEMLAHEIEAPPAVPAPTPARPVTPKQEGVLKGVPASPGLAAGSVFQLRRAEPVVIEQAGDAQHERRALDAAIATAQLQLEALQERVAAEADDERAGIFEAHQQLLDDPALLDTADALIRGGASAAYSWREAISRQAERLLSLNNPLIAARAADVRDVGRRVLHLLAGEQESMLQIPEDSIVIAEEISPSEIATLDRSRMRGICVASGSATSHAAILARALGIPAIAAIDPRALELPNGTRVIMDGDKGLLNTRPTAAQEVAFEREQAVSRRRQEADLQHAHAAAVTRDGHRVEIVANVGSVEEAHQAVALGAEGIGLLRTEFLFMERKVAPDEEEQTRVYRAIAQAIGRDRILVMRTLDVGGDKPLPYLPVGAEANPFLGERGIRLLLHRTDVLRTQVRAMLRAAGDANLAIMFPMVATYAEWQDARALVHAEAKQLGVRPPQLGIMVETAAAALLADHFAADADFFSIGTNDLTQYTLAMDRMHPRLAPQVDALHPSVLRLIDLTVRSAREKKRWVGVCGALASDPQAAPVLIGLGVHELSVSVPAIPAIKARIRALDMSACRETAQRALRARDADEVRALIDERHGEP